MGPPCCLCFWGFQFFGQARHGTIFRATYRRSPVHQFKHGFVRQDYHISAFFYFAAIFLALNSLPGYLRGETGPGRCSWWEFFDRLRRCLVPALSIVAISQAFGISSVRMTAGALRWEHLEQCLGASSAAFPLMRASSPN
jgi:hypothetical protein